MCQKGYEEGVATCMEESSGGRLWVRILTHSLVLNGGPHRQQAETDRGREDRRNCVVGARKRGFVQPTFDADMF